MQVEARLAGAIYLAVVLAGLFCLMWVPAQVPLLDGGPALLARIRAQETLFRSGMAGFVVMQVAFAMLALTLHRLLAHAGALAASMMVALALLSVPLGLVALQGRIALVGLVDAPLSSGELDLAVRHALDTWRHGLVLAQLFWGLWLLPLGVLVWRSRLAPRLLAACLVAGGLGYTVQVFAALVWPDAPAWLSTLSTPAAVGEIGLCLWLLIVNPSATSRSPRRCCPRRRRWRAA